MSEARCGRRFDRGAEDHVLRTEMAEDDRMGEGRA